MHLPRYSLSLLPIWTAYVRADFLGPTYPAPVDLSSNRSLVAAAWRNVTATFDSYLKDHINNTQTAALTGVENITFSLGLFSLHDPAAEHLQYHWTGHETATSPNGTHKVDGDSIYRMASVSKLFTVFAGMRTLSIEDWNRPITEINPGLAEAAAQGYQDPQLNVEWDTITPWALASQISGIPAEAWPALDRLYNFTLYATAGLPTEDPVTAWGMPPVDLSKMGPCWNVLDTCEGQDFIDAVRTQPPAFLLWTNPAYENGNFMLLGFMISNVTGKPMDVIYKEAIFDPLGLTSTFSSAPTDAATRARSVIVGPPALGFDVDELLATPSGGLLSTTNDLAKVGIAILNSTLLPANTTHKWMKPGTHTASLTYSVGAPWEIYRVVNPETGKVTDLYTKLGDSGFYGGCLVLIPDYDAGFSILNAYTGADRSYSAQVVLDYVATAILPALEAQAAVEATTTYAGTYVSTDPKLNSTVTIAFNQSTIASATGGLSITNWISNGTDVLNTDLFGGYRPRLLPTIPKQTPDGMPGQVAFQASTRKQTLSYYAPGAAKLGAIGPFTGFYNTNFDWLTVDAIHYGGISINLFVFDVDSCGKVTAVSPAATRAKLVKVSAVSPPAP